MPMRVVHGPRSRFWLLGASALAAAAALLPGAGVPAAAATAAPFAGQANLAADSCRSASWCMAVGGYTTTDHVRHSLAMIYNGTSWRSLKNPPGKGLQAVSCSSTTFCMAEGGPTGAVRWNGTSWRTMPSPKGGLESLSCASRTFCARLHGNIPSVWNGTSWQDAKVGGDFCQGSAPGPCGLASLSCGSTTNCAAVGTMTISQEPVQNAVAYNWNGKKWSFDIELPANGNPAQLNAVSCAGTFCMSAGVASNDSDRASIAVGDKFDATSQTWTDVSPDLGGICAEFGSCAWAGIVACGSSASCITIPGMRSSQFWNGSGWQSSKAVSAGRGSGLQDVSCGGITCLAVGFRKAHGLTRTLAELWNGSAWRIINTPKGP
jgi:hypothetical protein